MLGRSRCGPPRRLTCCTAVSCSLPARSVQQWARFFQEQAAGNAGVLVYSDNATWVHVNYWANPSAGVTLKGVSILAANQSDDLRSPGQLRSSIAAATHQGLEGVWTHQALAASGRQVPPSYLISATKETLIPLLLQVSEADAQPGCGAVRVPGRAGLCLHARRCQRVHRSLGPLAQKACL